MNAIGRMWLLPLSLSLAACAERQSGLSPDEFVAVLVAMREASAQAPDAETFAARRDSILGAAGVTEAELEAFVRSGNRDLRRVADAWDSAATRMRAAEGAE